VAGVGTAVASNHQVRVARQEIDDLAFALVTPMPADDRGNRHALTVAHED
jgi:hypothetical protein